MKLIDANPIPDGHTKMTMNTSFIDGNVEMAKDTRAYIPEVQQWLPLAAATYKISPNIKDYVVVPLIIFPSDLPNRNSVAFPYEELMKFNPHRGMPTYKTWRGMPTFVEHAHHDYEQAKGIIFDTYMKKMHDVVGDLYKVVALCGFDRKKDPALASRILNRKATRYSMGASVGTYECSICGALSPKNRRETECGHVTRGKISLHQTPQGLKPAYYLARDISGFEISSVGVPAWSAAEETDNIFDLYA